MGLTLLLPALPKTPDKWHRAHRIAIVVSGVALALSLAADLSTRGSHYGLSEFLLGLSAMLWGASAVAAIASVFLLIRAGGASHIGANVAAFYFLVVGGLGGVPSTMGRVEGQRDRMPSRTTLPEVRIVSAPDSLFYLVRMAEGTCCVAAMPANGAATFRVLACDGTISIADSKLTASRRKRAKAL